MTNVMRMLMALSLLTCTSGAFMAEAQNSWPEASRLNFV
jgi:hypothetical protein